MASFALEHLTFTYPGQTRPALSDLTLTIPEGAVTVLCGESGSGKSTLLRQLKTCLTPHGTVSGAVRLGDALLKGIPFAEQARRIGFVLQHPDDQIVTDKVFHELAFGLESLGCEEKTMRLCVAEMASYFGIADWFDRDVAALSSGQKQMLNLASVVVMRPDVLILDEPTSQLDPIAASTFLHTLRKLNEELGLTILLSEQRLEEAVPLADHLIVLEQGRLLAAGAPQEAAAAVRGHAIFSAMPTAARIAAALGETERLPLTVRAGRAYLGRFAPHPMPAAAPAPVDTPPVLTVRDGWFRYAQGSADVLRNFSLTLRPGELYALTGSNGSGKTTALGVLSGRLRLYRGSVYLDGKKQRALQPLRDGIAAVPQDPRTLFAADTVRADLASLGRDAALVDTVVRQMALAPLLDRHPFDLSGGEQQRAALAKVLLMQPRVLPGYHAARRADEGHGRRVQRRIRRAFARALRAGHGRMRREPRCGILRAVCRPLRPALSRRGRDGKRRARLFLRSLFLHHGGRAHRGRAGGREPHRHDRHQRHPARQGRPLHAYPRHPHGGRAAAHRVRRHQRRHAAESDLLHRRHPLGRAPRLYHRRPRAARHPDRNADKRRHRHHVRCRARRKNR